MEFDVTILKIPQLCFHNLFFHVSQHSTVSFSKSKTHSLNLVFSFYNFGSLAHSCSELFNNSNFLFENFFLSVRNRVY